MKLGPYARLPTSDTLFGLEDIFLEIFISAYYKAANYYLEKTNKWIAFQIEVSFHITETPYR